MNEPLVIAGVGFAVCWVLLVMCIRYSYRQRMFDERLNAPLLASYVHASMAATYHRRATYTTASIKCAVFSHSFICRLFLLSHLTTAGEQLERTSP